MVDIRVSGLVKSFDLEKRILDGLSFQVDSGERVGLLGRNGAGKTTVFRMLTGELEPDEGEVQIAAGRRVGLISQIPVYPEGYTVEDVLQTAFARMFRLKDEMDALALRMEQGDSGADTLRRYGELNAKFEGLGGWDTETAVNKVANGLSIPREMRQREFACLSGGEKTRVNLGRLILEDTDILLLDEPTNHLDIYTRENLTEALMAYTGTLLMVTHDRHLMNSLGCPILYLEDGKATLYPSYDALMGRAASAAAPEKAGDQPAKAGYGKEQRRRRAELRAKIKACEDEMEACGAREVELDNEINSPEVYNDPDLLRQKSDELSDLRFHQEELFAAWEKAMEEQEQYEQATGEE